MAKSKKKSTTLPKTVTPPPWPGLRRKIEELGPQWAEIRRALGEAAPDWKKAIDNIRAAYQRGLDREDTVPAVHDISELPNLFIQSELDREKRIAREIARALKQNEPAKHNKHRGGRKAALVEDLLKVLFPPNGRPPKHVSLKTVHGNISAECEKRKIKPPPGRDTVARVLRRRK